MRVDLENGGQQAPSQAKLKKNSETLGKLRGALTVLSKAKAKPKLSDAQRAELKKIIEYLEARADGAGKLKAKTDAIIAKQGGAKGTAEGDDESATVESEFKVFTGELQVYFVSYFDVMSALSNISKAQHEAAMTIIANLKG